MDDRVMQGGFRRILTVGDDTSAGFGSLPVLMFHEPADHVCSVTIYLLSSFLLSAGLILSRPLCFTSLSPSFSPSSSLVPVDCVSGGDGEGRDG